MVWGKPVGSVDKTVDLWIEKLLKDDASLTNLTILGMRKVTKSQFCQLFDSLKVNSQLKNLYISGHELDLETVTRLSEALKTNLGLTCISVPKLNEVKSYQVYFQGLQQFQGTGGISVDLSNNKLLELEGVDQLLYQLFLENLKVDFVNLNHSSLTFSHLENIANSILNNSHHQLKVKLDLSNNLIQEFSSFFQYFQLDKFKVDGIAIYGIQLMGGEQLNQILKSIRGNSHLKSLELALVEEGEDKVYLNKKVEETDIQVFNSFFHLFVDEAGDKFISSSLETLILNGINFGWQLHFKTKLEHKFESSLLTQLVLRRVQFTDKVFPPFFDLITQFIPNLNCLDLGINFLSDTSFQHILLSNQLNKLTKLTLIGNEIKLDPSFYKLPLEVEQNLDQEQQQQDQQQQQRNWNQLESLDLNCNLIQPSHFNQFLLWFQVKKDNQFKYFTNLKVLELANQLLGNSDKDQLETEWDEVMTKLKWIRINLMLVYKLNK